MQIRNWFLLFGAIIAVKSGFAAQETVNKLYINKPPTATLAPAPEKIDKKKDPIVPAAGTVAPPALNPAVNMEDVDKLLKEGPFNVFANPKFRKFMEFLTNKKMINALNELADKSKMKFMMIGQLVLILLSLFLRSAITANTKGFISTFFANTWIAALHFFLALVVLPRFLYGPHYFDLMSELYKVVSAQG